MMAICGMDDWEGARSACSPAASPSVSTSPVAEPTIAIACLPSRFMRSLRSSSFSAILLRPTRCIHSGILRSFSLPPEADPAEAVDVSGGAAGGCVEPTGGGGSSLVGEDCCCA